jgi:hypothetical protein
MGREGRHSRRRRRDFVWRDGIRQSLLRFSARLIRTLSVNSAKASRIGGLCVGLSGLCLLRAAAQQPYQVPESQTCRECRIELRPLVRVGSRDGPGIVSGSEVMTRNRRGEYLVAHGLSRGTFQVFSAQGRHLLSIGKRGKGPGEYEFISEIVCDSAGVTFVFDHALRRLTVLDSTYRVVKTHSLSLAPEPGSHAVLVDQPKGIFIGQHVPSKELSGVALHLIDSLGTVRSLPETGDGFRVDAPTNQVRILAAGDGGRAWSARVNAYRVDLWNLTSSKIVSTYIRKPRWFSAWIRRGEISPEGGLVPEIKALQYDRLRGWLWVIVQVPSSDKDWYTGLVSEIGPDGRKYYGPGDLNKVYDSIVEIIDTKSGRLVLSQRLGPNLRRFIAPGEAISIGTDGDGSEYIQVWRIQTTHPKPRGREP